MVGWARRGAESRARQAAAALIEKKCIEGGCKCYCHEPKPRKGNDKIAYLIILFCGFLYVGMLLLLMSAKKSNPPVWCEGITSTGAPRDCHIIVPKPEDSQ